MPGPYGDLQAGRTIVKTKVDGQAIVGTLDGEDEGPEESAYIRQPLGLRARPRDKRGNAIVAQDGNYPEILLVWDPKLNLPDIAAGATQLHSCGASPQLIEVADDKIKLGKDAQEAVIKGDTYRTAEDTFFDALNNLLTTAGAALNSAGTDPTLVATAKKAAASLVTAGGALNGVTAAVNAFKNNSKNYLSTLVKTE